MDESSFEQVLDAVRRFVRERVIPREDEIETTDAIPDDLRADIAELGLFGYALPAEFGGSGVTMSQDVRLAFEFGYTTPAFRSLFGTNNGIAGQVIAKFGSRDQQEAFLPALAAGDMIASFALTESEAGSSPGRTEDIGAPRRQRLDPVRHQAVHHQRAAGRPVRRLRPQRPRRRGGPRHLGLRGRRSKRGTDRRAARSQDGPARRLDRRGELQRRPGAGRAASSAPRAAATAAP